MSTITATDAKNKFGQVLDEAQRAPVHVQKNGRDVAVVISAAEYARLSAANADAKVSPRVQQLLAESMVQRRTVYEALAK
ncbi:type II toxin-antitoxin system Phd/YefM family antitoxin [Devosia alba]|uniref:type II toxin-antitoxin system Phd/YefM family antitoxin n=1 Tax=Devosia alba TaxID=3152360 RepID=UPI0032638FB4